MDKLKYIKIKQEDGSYSEEIPVGVDASNVDMSDGRTLPETLGLIDVDANGTVKQQLDELNKNKVDEIDHNEDVLELRNNIDKKVNSTEYYQKINELEEENELQNERINQMIQNPGESTEGNSELLDIRIGYDGTEHDTAGNAVRNQTKTLVDKIENLILNGYSHIKDVIDVSQIVFEKGSYNITNGTPFPDDVHIRTKEFLLVPKKYFLKTEIRIYILYYTSIKEYISYERFDSSENVLTLNIPKNAFYMHIVIGDVNSNGNLDDANKLSFFIYGAEYQRGNLSSTLTLSNNRLTSTELNINKDNKIIARMPFSASGTLQLYKNGILMKSVNVSWEDYTCVENIEFYDFALISSTSVTESLKNSVAFGGKTERSAITFDSSLSVTHGTEEEETTSDQYYTTNPTDIYFLIRVPRVRTHTFSTNTTPVTPAYLWSCGVLRLPKTYSYLGKKTPIAFFAHGTSGWVGNGAVQSQFNRCNYLVDNGIACFDVNGWLGCYGNELPPTNRNNGQNMGNPSACICVHKAFEYIKNIYNIEDKCLVFGNSMGGLLALNYANNYRGEIYGCFLLYPVTDLKGQAWDNPWNNKCQSNIKDFYIMPEDTYDEKCTYGYNPINNNYIGIPIFIWHGTSDTTVSYQGSVDFANKQNSQGGGVYLRTVDGLTHGNYNSWKNIFETESILAVNRFITTENSLH